MAKPQTRSQAKPTRKVLKCVKVVKKQYARVRSHVCVYDSWAEAQAEKQAAAEAALRASTTKEQSAYVSKLKLKTNDCAG